MAAMSGNVSSTSLMGFSVHQPAIGAPLQFFPAMGSKQLDEMISTYVPGPFSILNKRAAVSLEFFDHTIQTGELFKFFLVYPTLGSTAASPASSSAMQDSGYGSSFNTSPVMSESQWTHASNVSCKRSTHSKARSSSKKATSSTARSQPGDFSNIPGMKIMTKDGRDVTNSASRGCKTKEQRDHAHLMRVMKACDSCKQKKTRCDPSHKRGSSAVTSPGSKAASKKAKKAASPPAPKRNVFEVDMAIFDPTKSEPQYLDDRFDTVADSTVDTWDQFIQYDEEFADVVPQDYDFFFDPAGYFSPTTSTSTSPSQVLTPGQSQPVTPAGVGVGSQQPTLPYLNPAGLEVGSNYVDFALYSPGSTCPDDDLLLSKEVAALESSEHSGYLHRQQSSRSHSIVLPD
ncbi:hypothetical protein BJ170DRAFT_563837, partial [Xylariales sp. AK1849]